jgi:hypothetical protein
MSNHVEGAASLTMPSEKEILEENTIAMGVELDASKKIAILSWSMQRRARTYTVKRRVVGVENSTEEVQTGFDLPAIGELRVQAPPIGKKTGVVWEYTMIVEPT